MVDVAKPSSVMRILRMRDIRKRFGPVEVLRGVKLDLFPGEVHILAGENGAGKSTLMKILGGVYGEYDGTIELDGRIVRFNSPLEANANGVAVIYQELSLVPALSIADNLFLGRNLTRSAGFVRDRAQRELARKYLGRVGLEIDPDRLVERLPIAQQQLVEIAKALALDAKIIVMDEPTSALNAPEVCRLFELIDDLKRCGAAIVYISHKMEEIARVADRITVLRDGAYVGSAPASELPVPKLVEWMVGREMGAQFPRHATRSGEVCLEVNDFSVRLGGSRMAKAHVDRVNFKLHRGEILGIGGLQGSGASELLGGLFGAFGARATSGTALLDRKSLKIDGPSEAIAQGVAMLTNDRKATGLVLPLSILANATLASLPRVSPAGWRRESMERSTIEPLTRALRLRAASLSMDVGALSGGNQQKVAIAKWLATKPKLLLLDEPTRGIDIGAKREIYQLMNEWTAQGISILLITSELPELLALSDRVIVMHRGMITAELSRAQATPEGILSAAMGQIDEAFSAPAVRAASAAIEVEVRGGEARV
jgi:ribose transport system ATP-binding protein